MFLFYIQLEKDPRKRGAVNFVLANNAVAILGHYEMAALLTSGCFLTL